MRSAGVHVCVCRASLRVRVHGSSFRIATPHAALSDAFTFLLLVYARSNSPARAYAHGAVANAPPHVDAARLWSAAVPRPVYVSGCRR